MACFWARWLDFHIASAQSVRRGDVLRDCVPAREHLPVSARSWVLAGVIDWVPIPASLSAEDAAQPTAHASAAAACRLTGLIRLSYRGWRRLPPESAADVTGLSSRRGCLGFS